jgi:hypothetical protein
MAAPTSTRPREFALTVPGHWATFDVTQQELSTARRAAMRQATSAADRIAIDDVFEQAKRVTRSARKAGALWGAGTATVYDDELFVAHVMVFAVSAPRTGDFTAPVLGSVLGGARSGQESDLPARSVSTVRLRDVEAAVRVSGREVVEVVPGKSVQMLVSHTFVPVPGAEGEHMLITGCSPNLPLEDDVLDLFDAIAETFHFLEKSDVERLAAASEIRP